MTPRRRKARHSLNPLGWVPPETVALVGKAVGAGLVVAFPALAVRQEGLGKQQTANEATNVALGAAAALTDSVVALRWEMGLMREELRREMRESRLREARTAARLPEALVGPALPSTWEVRPARKGWWARIRGG